MDREEELKSCVGSALCAGLRERHSFKLCPHTKDTLLHVHLDGMSLSTSGHFETTALGSVTKV